MNEKLSIVILAAGKGTRMKSPLPKVLHAISGKPMVFYVTEAAQALRPRKLIVIVGYKAALVRKTLGKDFTYALQRHQRGTGHAVKQAEKIVGPGSGHVIVLAGDVPFIRSKTLLKLYRRHVGEKAKATVLTVRLKDPGHYGRIVRSTGGKVKKIVEFKDASDSERRIREINSGIYAFCSRDLWDALKEIKPQNEQGEYYLTDVIEIMIRKNKRVLAVNTPDAQEVMGINNVEELKVANAVI